MGPWKLIYCCKALSIIAAHQVKNVQQSQLVQELGAGAWQLSCWVTEMFPAEHWRSRHEGLVSFSRPSHISPIWFCAGISWVPGWVTLLSVDIHWVVHAQIQTNLHQLLVWVRKIENLLNFWMWVFQSLDIVWMCLSKWRNGKTFS